MDDDAPLWRPTLSSDAFLRTYVSDAGRGWVLVQREPGRRLRLDSVQRRLLELCDGRRTVDELADAIGGDMGRPLSARGVLAALEPLVAAGALVHAGQEPPRTPAARRGLEVRELDTAAADALSLAIAPGIGFDCDGRGVCCGLYERLLLDPEDAANIHAAYGDELVPGGLSVESAVHCHRDDRSGELLELAVLDGACVLLEPDRRCGVHRRLGIERKPEGCRAYPIRDVVCDGELAVGLAVECRCVIDFAAGPPIDAMAEAQRARRRRMGLVEVVADRVPLTLARTAPRDQYRAWRDAARVRLAEARDVAAWALDEARTILREATALDEARTILREAAARDEGRTILRDATARDAAAPGFERGGFWAERLPASLAPLLDAIGRLFAVEAANTAEVYSPRDLQRQAFAWARDAFAELRAALRRGEPPSAETRGERILAEQVLHAHGLLRSRTLAGGLGALGLRILLARAGAALPLAAELLPIPTVEYLHRAHAFSRLLDEHAAVLERALGD